MKTVLSQVFNNDCFVSDGYATVLTMFRTTEPIVILNPFRDDLPVELHQGHVSFLMENSTDLTDGYLYGRGKVGDEYVYWLVL